MAGVRLEAKVHIVTGAVSSAQNIVKCCATAPGSTWPTSCCSRSPPREAVLAEDEKELGRRAGRHRRRHHRHRHLLRRAPSRTPRCIAARRQPPHQRHRRRACARRRTRRSASSSSYGCAHGVAWSTRTRPSRCRAWAAAQPRVLAAPASSARSSSRGWRRSSSWCSARSRSAGYEDLLASGVVITGGSTLLHGMPELAEEVLGLPVRRGRAARHRRAGRRGEEPAVRDRGGPACSTARGSDATSRALQDPRTRTSTGRCASRMPKWLGGDLLATVPRVTETVSKARRTDGR